MANAKFIKKGQKVSVVLDIKEHEKGGKESATIGGLGY
jgi:hypothetical protein